VLEGHTTRLDQSHFRAMADGLSLARMRDRYGMGWVDGKVMNVLEGHTLVKPVRISIEGGQSGVESCLTSYIRRKTVNLWISHTYWMASLPAGEGYLSCALDALLPDFANILTIHAPKFLVLICWG